MTKVRCGKCDRVLGAPQRRRRPSRTEREEWQNLDVPAFERMEAAATLVDVPTTPNFSGRLTVTRGVVTANCKCGQNGQMSFDDFEAGYRQARGRREDFFLFLGAP